MTTSRSAQRPTWRPTLPLSWRWTDPAEASVGVRLLATLAVLVPLWLGVAWAARA